MSGDASFNNSPSVGARFGYWLDFFPYVGAAIDVSYFQPDIDAEFGNRIHSIPIAPLAMFRLPLLESDERPHGMIQPYAGIGPAFFYTVVDNGSLRFDGRAWDVGYDVRAGTNLQALSWLGVFIEYRYTSYEAKVDDDVLGIPTDVDVELDTHHIGGGLRFSF